MVRGTRQSIWLMVKKIPLREGCTSSRVNSQCHPSVPPPIHDNVMNMVMLFTVFASVPSTGYGRACETEEACGNVNVQKTEGDHGVVLAMWSIVCRGGVVVGPRDWTSYGGSRG